MVAFHRSTGAKATILLTPVADPCRYGLVRTAADGRVETFLEKPRPEEIDTDLINAGLYVLEPEVLDLVPPGRAVSIEREVFPRLAAEGSVYGIALPGYWLDVGTPESYLQAHRDVLERIFPTEVGDALGADFTLVDPTRDDQPEREARAARLRRAGCDRRRARAARHPRRPRRGGDARRGLRRRERHGRRGHEHRRRRPASSARSSATASSSAPACELSSLAVVGPGAVVGEGNVLDHGLRIGAGQRIPDEALRFS